MQPKFKKIIYQCFKNNNLTKCPYYKVDNKTLEDLQLPIGKCVYSETYYNHKNNKLIICNKITRKQALKISNNILKKAEKERKAI